MKKIIFALGLAAINFSAWAEPQTVRLHLPTMNCAMCPITVKKALDKVEGVISVEVSYEQKQAIVVFEDTKVSVDKLVDTTFNAGYPSSIMELE